MSEVFHDVASIDYPIIDADAHVNEPPELWAERVPAKYKQRAPRVEKAGGGEIWVFDDGKEKWPVGLTAVAGLSVFDWAPIGAVTYETMRPGSFDVKARLADMDADRIHAQLLYPSVTLKGAKIYSEDRELQLACVRAYNEWLVEFCEGSGGRLIGQAIIPTTGVEDAIAELEWGLKHDLRSGIISSFPSGSTDGTEPEDDRFWGLAQEAQVPIAVHIGSFIRGIPPRKGGWSSLNFCGMAAWTKAGGQTLGVVCDLLFSGIYTRFPGLRTVLVESNIGWIPTLLEQGDDMYRRYRWYTKAVEEQAAMPSEIFHRNFWATFMVDTVGMDLRHRLNTDHLMWSTDYPHSGTDWPDSRVTIERVFRGVERDLVKKMLHTNCKELYHLDHVPDVLP